MKLTACKNAATLAFSVAFAGAVMAQSPTPQTPQQPPTTPQTRPAPGSQQGGQDNLRGMIGQTVTVSGCLTQDRASAGQATMPTPGTTGTPGTPGAPGTERTGAASAMASGFVLTNVQMRSGAPTPGATDTPSTTGTPSPTGAAGAMAGAGGTKLKLKASGTTDLSENVNKRVEVTGRLEAASDHSGMTHTPGTTPGTPGTPGAPVAPGAPGTPETGAPSVSARGAMGSMPELQVSNVRVLEQACTPQQ